VDIAQGRKRNLKSRKDGDMGDCISENSKIEAFDLAISHSDKFEIAGLDESETKFVLRNIEVSEGVNGRYLEIDIAEVESAPLKDVLAVINGDRNDIVVKGYTRVVGYYSGIHNWNNSKLSELEDRHVGTYGTPNFNPKHNDETKGSLNKMRVAYGN